MSGIRTLPVVSLAFAVAWLAGCAVSPARGQHGPDFGVPDSVAGWSAPGSEFAERAQAGVFELEHPQLGLRFRCDGAGLRVLEGRAPAGRELARLVLASAGRGAQPLQLPEGVAVRSGARVEIQRPALVEWYGYAAAGLEQGFTLSERSEGEGPLRLEIEVSGALAVQRDGRVALHSDVGRVLDYGELAAFDADLRPLPARLSLAHSRRIRLEIEDAGARYPLVVDPLITASFDERAAISSLYSLKVERAGDVNRDGFEDLLVGEFGNVIAVLYGSATGIAAEADVQLRGRGVASVVAAGAGDVNGDGFDDVILGDSLAGTSDAGEALIFLGSAAGIPDGSPRAASTRLRSLVANLNFGISVASAGDVDGDGFGDVVIGGRSPGASGTSFLGGAAFVFRGSASGIPSGSLGSAAATLAPTEGLGSFGVPVAGAGDLNGDGYDDIVVGDRRGPGRDAVFVFHGSASGIPNGSPALANQVIQPVVPAGFVADLADMSLASAGDVDADGYAELLVGARRGTYLLPGPFPGSFEGNFDEGLVFVFRGGANGIASGSVPDSLIRGAIENRHLGSGSRGVAGAGDVNGDGYDDIAISDTSRLAPSGRAGALVFLGSASGIPSAIADEAPIRLQDPIASEVARGSVALADVNGDGASDVVADALLEPDPETGEIFHGVLVSRGSAQLSLDDLDGDGAQSSADNCSRVPNPSQLDADSDGCGNACDADYDQSGTVNAGDLNSFRQCYGRRVGAAGPPADPLCAEADHDGSGMVTIGDFQVLRGGFGLAPGPSAVGGCF